MITKQITATNANEKIKKLYETAFPEDEQIPMGNSSATRWGNAAGLHRLL